MTDKPELYRRINIAQRAQRILDDDLVVTARESVRASLLKAWEDSPAKDSDGRERLYLMLKLHDRVWAHLTDLINDGKVADSELPLEERRGLVKF